MPYHGRDSPFSSSYDDLNGAERLNGLNGLNKTSVIFGLDADDDGGGVARHFSYNILIGMNGEGETCDDQDTNAFDGDPVARRSGARYSGGDGLELAPWVAR